MEILIVGLIIFYGVHMVPIFELKNTLINKMGKHFYLGLFALISLVGLGLMIYGKGNANFIPVWQPIEGAHWVPVILMWPALIFTAWAEIPCNMKIRLRHPMLLGVLLFSVAHLIANGDLASILLIGSFGLYALLTMLRLGFKSNVNGKKVNGLKWDVAGVVIGTLAYGLIFHFHEQIMGRVIPI